MFSVTFNYNIYGSAYGVERYDNDTEDKLDEDEDAVVDSGGTGDDGIYDNDGDFDPDGNEGEDNGCDSDGCSDGGSESKGCDSDASEDSDDDGDGEDSEVGGDDDSEDGDDDSEDGGDDDSEDGGDDDSEDGGGVPARTARGQCHPSQLLNVYLTRGWCCNDSCLMMYGDMPRVRALTLSRLDKKTRKAVVFGMLAVIRNKCGFRNFHIFSLPLLILFVFKSNLVALE